MKKQTKQTKAATKTIVNFILDKSGSMGSVKDATISGFNEYLKTLKKDAKGCEFSLTLFDTVVKTPYVGEPLKNVKELDSKSYVPDGMTALYDAVCKTIEDAKKKVTKGVKVLTVIMTDGEENASKEYTEKNLKELVSNLEATKMWSFVFLGANQDSWKNAGAWGFASSNIANFNQTDKGITATFAMVASNTSASLRSMNFDNAAFFSKDDQATLEKTK